MSNILLKNVAELGMGFLIKTGLILKPGQKGTKKLTAEYGDRPVCVRYRYDETRKR